MKGKQVVTCRFSSYRLCTITGLTPNPAACPAVREKLLQREYDSPTAVFSDVRLMLRNCYRYNGPQHSVTRRALRLEHIMEQLIDQLEP